MKNGGHVTDCTPAIAGHDKRDHLLGQIAALRNGLVGLMA
jgi:hypothetical protein